MEANPTAGARRVTAPKTPTLSGGRLVVGVPQALDEPPQGQVNPHVAREQGDWKQRDTECDGELIQREQGRAVRQVGHCVVASVVSHALHINFSGIVQTITIHNPELFGCSLAIQSDLRYSQFERIVRVLKCMNRVSDARRTYKL